MSAIFDPNRIVPADVPALFVHGTRRIDVLDGNILQLWLCLDQPTTEKGIAPLSVPVVRVHIPIRSYVWNVMACMEWGFNRGLLRTPGVGPTELRPKHRALLM